MVAIECSRCGGSGFERAGTGYGDVCSECGGQINPDIITPRDMLQEVRLLIEREVNPAWTLSRVRAKVEVLRALEDLLAVAIGPDKDGNPA